MIFITKVKLNNFQSHKKTELEFHRGLNVIVGHSDSGKTAILRAIKWAIYNEPSGDYFIREGEREVSVEVEFNTGAVIRRFRTPSKNGYYLKKADGEEITFDGFGTKVPKEITDEIKIDKINLDEKSTSMINISEQLEGPFLLNEKASVRASAIGRLVGVNYIDDALRDTIRDSKQVASNLKNMVVKENQLKEELAKYDYLEDYEKRHNLLTEIKEKIDKLNNKINLYRSLNEKYENLNREKGEITDLLNKYSGLENIQFISEKLDREIIRLKEFQKEYSSYRYIEESIKNNMLLLEKYKNLDSIEIQEKELRDRISVLKNLNTLSRRYNEVTENRKNVERELAKYSNLEEVEFKIRSLNDNILKFDSYSVMNNEYLKLSKGINTGKLYLKQLERIDDIDILYSEIEKKIKKYTYIEEKINILKSISDEKFRIDDMLKKLDSNIDFGIEKYNDILLQSGYCPVCLSKIDNNTISHIKEHFKG